jgi:hypothetical protein
MAREALPQAIRRNLHGEVDINSTAMNINSTAMNIASTARWRAAQNRPEKPFRVVRMRPPNPATSGSSACHANAAAAPKHRSSTVSEPKELAAQERGEKSQLAKRRAGGSGSKSDLAERRKKKD